MILSIRSNCVDAHLTTDARLTVCKVTDACAIIMTHVQAREKHVTRTSEHVSHRRKRIVRNLDDGRDRFARVNPNERLNKKKKKKKRKKEKMMERHTYLVRNVPSIRQRPTKSLCSLSSKGDRGVMDDERGWLVGQEGEEEQRNGIRFDCSGEDDPGRMEKK